MACWTLYESSRQVLTLIYRNGFETFNCGDVRVDTPLTMILSWIYDQPSARPGDLIKVPQGVLQILPETRS